MAKCSYFGLKDNPKATLDFASYGNYCYHAVPAAPPKNSHQNAFCLFENHKTCPVFRLNEKRPLPENVAVIDNRSKYRENFSYQIIGGIFLLFAIALTAAMVILGDSSSLATIIPEGVQFVVATNPIGVIDGSSTSTTEPSPTANLTRAACHPPDGSVPYTVEPFDSIFQLSLTFEIKVVDLLAANCMREDTNLQAGEIIYIPLKRTYTPTKPPIIILSATTGITPFTTSTPTREIESKPPTPIPQPSRTPVPEPPTEVPPPPTPTSPPPPTSPPEPNP